MPQTFSIDEVLEMASRLEKWAFFTVEPGLEAQLDTLVAELDTLVDHLGRPRHNTSEGARDVSDVVAEIETIRDRILASRRGVRMRGLSADDWDAFRKRHHNRIVDSTGGVPQVVAVRLIAACAVEPELSIEDVEKLYEVLGGPQMKVLIDTAFHVNLADPAELPRIDGFDRVKRNL